MTIRGCENASKRENARVLITARAFVHEPTTLIPLIGVTQLSRGIVPADVRKCKHTTALTLTVEEFTGQFCVVYDIGVGIDCSTSRVMVC